MHTDTQVVELVFTIVTGIGVLLQALVLLAIAMGLKETQKKIHALTESIEKHALPLMKTSRGLIDNLTPQIKTITANLVDVSTSVKQQTQNVKTVVEDVTERTKKQTARADNMMTGALNSIAQAGAAVERGIAAPLRQVTGVLNGLRAGLDTLRVRDARPANAATATPLSPLAAANETTAGTGSPLRTVVPVADTLPISDTIHSGTASDATIRAAVDPVIAAEPLRVQEVGPDESAAASRRLNRDRAAVSSGERR